MKRLFHRRRADSTYTNELTLNMTMGWCGISRAVDTANNVLFANLGLDLAGADGQPRYAAEVAPCVSEVRST